MKLVVLDRNKWNHLTVCKKKKEEKEKNELRLVYKCYPQNVFINHILNVYV